MIRPGLLTGLFLVAVMVAAGSEVMPGANPPPGSVASDRSITQTVIQYPQPPRSFDPLSATDTELANYGIPPRPDPKKAPTVFRHWKKIVAVPRVTNGQLQPTQVYNGPIRQASRTGILKNGTVSITSLNWSGYAVAAPSGTFTPNGSF